MQASNRIEVFNGYDDDAYTYFPVLIVGAGESGIGMGCQLKRLLGFDQFRICDRQSGMGGTWWINRYPGVACDVPCLFYSFSWEPFYTAPELYPSGQTVVKYLHRVAAKYGIQDKVQLNTDVTECRWSEEEQLWHATLSHMAPGTGDMSAKERFAYIEKHGTDAVYLKQEKIKAKVIVSCVGGLVEPKGFPEDIPGASDFKGDIFHAARWRKDIDLTDKDVVVVGTGCSAAQVVPSILKPPYKVKSVTQLMKSPPWIAPKAPEPGGKKWYAENAPTLFTYAPFLAWMFREWAAIIGEWHWFTYFYNTRFNRWYRNKVEGELNERMRSLAPPKYYTELTPNYSIGCKRRIFDAEWYKCMHRDNFRLTTRKLARVTPYGLVLDMEKHYPPGAPSAAEEEEVHADVIVLANGYDTTKWLHPLVMIGRDGRNLYDVWDERGGPQAYLGTAMDGFPNFFMIFGPNIVTGHSSVILQSELGILLLIKLLTPLLNGEARTLEVKKDAEVAYTARVQRELKKLVIGTGGCGNWYFDPKTGWNGTAYPRSQIDYWWRCTFPTWRHWMYDYTRTGRTKLYIRRAVKAALFAACLVGLYQARQAGVAWTTWTMGHVRTTLARVLRLSQSQLRAAELRVSG